MRLDFSVVLLAVVLISASLLLQARFAPRFGPSAAPASVLRQLRWILPLVLAVLLVRAFVVEPFRIPSGSMLPTLQSGDFILVDKAAYGLRIPDLGWTLVPGDRPERGDVVVFRYPPDPTARYVKRVVGLPGDRVTVSAGRLSINGAPVLLTDLGTYQGPGAVGTRLHEEQLGEHSHQLVLSPGVAGPEDDFVVPEGHYYVLGDHRGVSNDSRRWGAVPDSHLIGRATRVWLHWGPERGLDWGRTGEVIR